MPAFFNKIRRAAEKLLAPGGSITYAQSGEDMILDFLVDYRPSGFYVDVGCNRPFQNSNTYRFYRKGWRGVAIDANDQFSKPWKLLRPRDKFVCAAVSDEDKSVDFHVFNASGLSSISGKKLYDNDEHYQLDRVDRLTTRRLTDILEEASAPAQFDILSIDVEGHDEAVLRSLDLARFRPRVIVVEVNDTEFDPAHPMNSDVGKYLASNRYELVAMNWSNLFFREV